MDDGASCRCHGITHSYQPGKGENTYFAFATVPEALGTPAFNFQDAVDSWYSEIEFWNFTTGAAAGLVCYIA